MTFSFCSWRSRPSERRLGLGGVRPDATEQELEALRRGKVVWSNAPGVKPGDLLPEE